MKCDPYKIRDEIMNQGANSWDEATASGAFGFSYNNALDDVQKKLSKDNTIN